MISTFYGGVLFIAIRISLRISSGNANVFVATVESTLDE